MLMWVAAASRSHRGNKAGQSLIESCIVIGLTCLIFLGMFQVSQLFAAKEILTYAAGRGARARTVGFNSFMVYKTIRVGAIPNAGLLISPEFTRGPSTWNIDTPENIWGTWRAALGTWPPGGQYLLERSRIPLYLGADYHGQLDPILDYEDWDTITRPNLIENDVSQDLSLRISQQYPLRLPLHRTFYAAEDMTLEAEIKMENHYPVYMYATDEGY